MQETAMPAQTYVRSSNRILSRTSTEDFALLEPRLVRSIFLCASSPKRAAIEHLYSPERSIPFAGATGNKRSIKVGLIAA
jgi:hypothetical protein